MKKLLLKDFLEFYAHQFDLYKSIKNSYLFNQLDEKSIEKIIDFFNVLILEQDEILFRQGDQPDNLYILATGQLTSSMLKEKDWMTIGKIYPGETVGELGVLNHSPRTLTIKALNFCILLELSRENFFIIWKEFMSVQAQMQLISSIITRSQNIIKILSKENIFIHSAIILDYNSEYNQFVNNLKLLQKNNHVQIVENLYHENNANKIKKENILNIIQDARHNKTTLIFIINRKLIFENQNEDILASIHFILENIHGLYLSDSDIIKKSEVFFNQNHYPHIKQKGFIFLYQANESTYSKNHCFPHDLFNCHYHIKMDSHQDIKRLLRYLSGNAIGLVCSGGGSKGWASIGVIKALQEAHIPIDAVGGTSSGSIVSSAYSLTQDYQNMLEVSKDIFMLGYSDISLKNLSFPLVSITNGRILTEGLKNMFKELHTEDLWLPNFSIACNLSTGEEVVQTSGLVWENLRASCSLPLIYPPVTKNGQIYLDGGLLNNFPIDQMRKMIGKKSFIIGVNLSTLRQDRLHYFIPHIMPFYTSLMARLKIGYKNIKYPPLLSTFLSSLLIGSSSRAAKNALDTNLLIEPELSQYPMLGLHPKKIHQLIEIGYRSCHEKLEQIDLADISDLF